MGIGLHRFLFLPFGAGCRFLVFRGCAWRVDRGCWRRLFLVWQVGGRRRFVGRRAGGGNGLFEGGWKGIGIGLARFSEVVFVARSFFVGGGVFVFSKNFPFRFGEESAISSGGTGS